MPISRFIVLVPVSVLLASICACANLPPADGEESEHEETGSRLAINQTFDAVRNGVRLVLAWDSASSSFIGSVDNVTDETISSVRVEVHLSNGTELGPTSPVDLAPGEQTNVKLPAAGQSFDWWKAHAETSEGGEEGEGEYRDGDEHESGGEHGGEGD